MPEAYSVLLADKSMTPQGFLPFSIDAMKFSNDTLYFTNIAQITFNRLSIDVNGRFRMVSAILNNSPGDDFTFDAAGNLYIINNTPNSVIRVDAAGKVTKLSTVKGSTSTAFRQTERDDNLLHVGSSQETTEDIAV